MIARLMAVPPIRRVVAVARKELRQLFRDRLSTAFVVGVPLMQLMLFGYAINQDVRHVPAALVDHSNTDVSRRLAGQLEATQTFDFIHRLADPEEAKKLMRQGDVRVVVEIPREFAHNFYRGRGGRISLLVDAADPTIARAVRSAAEGLAEDINRRQAPFQVGQAEGVMRVPRERDAFWAEPDLVQPELMRFTVLNHYNPEMRTAVFVVPALLGVILTTTMILMTALAIVRERERGTFEFLIGTPVSRMELMVGKIVPYVGIGFVQISLVLAAGLLLFRVPVEGSLFDLMIGALVFIAANLSLGLVISSVTSSQFQATQASFLFFLPSVLLSGFMFPFGAMPKPAQWLGELLPLTHFVRICRGVLLRDSTLADQSGEIGAMLVFLVVGMVAAARLFRKEL